MDEKALIKARSRLRVAQNALADLIAIQDDQTFSDHWFTLLVSTKSVWTALEQGAKAGDRSRKWFGEKNRDRKASPLLKYMFAARNHEEHGLRPVIESVSPVVSSSAKFRLPGGCAVLGAEIDPKRHETTIIYLDPSGAERTLTLPDTNRRTLSPRLNLSPVRERDGTIVLPPWEIDIEYPLDAAFATIRYLAGLLDEAGGLVPPISGAAT